MFFSLLGPVDKDRVASLEIGLNPENKPMGFSNDEFGLGVVSIGIGENRSLGGINNSDYEFAASMAKATVKVDGKTFSRKGQNHHLTTSAHHPPFSDHPITATSVRPNS